MKLVINRWYCDDVTLGRFSLEDEGSVLIDKVLLAGFTLELPWLDNLSRISCIPEGVYRAHKRSGGRNGHCFELEDTLTRTYIQGHTGNSTDDIEGCILFGDSIKDIYGNDTPEVCNSKNTFKKVMDMLPEKFTVVLQ